MEEQRQEEQLMDTLNIKEPKKGHEGIVVETVGVHTVDSTGSGISKATANTQESTTCGSTTGSKRSYRQCHGEETKTPHARINFLRSPSHLKEDVEMEFRVPSAVLSHRTNSYHTGTEASSIGSLSTTSDRNARTPASVAAQFSLDSDDDSYRVATMEDAANHTVILKETQEQLRVTKEQWKATQKELRDNKKELAQIREKAQIVKRELKNFNQEWESQQTLLRNKDKELERLRLIIADRTLQLTEKTGELSITKVALVASENGLAASKKQLHGR